MTETVAIAMPPLLAALRHLPTGSLYIMGDKKALVEALVLCQKQAVRPPQWERGRSMLTVDVFDGQPYEVTLSLEQECLITHCDCQWEPSLRSCRHQLAALLTLKGALDPAAVSSLRDSNQAFGAIRAALLEAPGQRGQPKIAAETADSLAIVLEDSYGFLSVQLTRNGLPLQPSDPVPAALSPLRSSPYGYGVRAGAILTALLDRSACPCPIMVAVDGGLLPLTIEEPVTRRGLLRLTAERDGLLISRALEDGTVLGERLLHLGSWVADLDARRLLRISPPEAWTIWEELRTGARAVSGGYRLPWEKFSGLELLASEDEPPALEELLLLNGAQEEQVAVQPMTGYALTIDSSSNADLVHLTAVARTGDRSLPLDRRALALFSEDFIRDIGAPLRTLKRRRVLYETFFAGRRTATKTERTRLVRAALQTPDFRRRAVAREAREILTSFFELDQDATCNLTFAEGRWQLLRHDREREVLLLETLYRHFGETAFREALLPGQAQAPRGVFFARLPQLLTELTAAGMELLFAGRTLASSALQIEVDATAAGIDWFELRPEIRCDGLLLDEASWRQALVQGVFESGGVLRLLNEESRQALAILADLTGPASRKLRQVVRIPRLHILDVIAMRRLGAKLRLKDEDEAILQSLASFDSLPEQPLPELRATLRDYQRFGYRWLAFLYGHKFGACLADDMGLGKTIQAISLLAALQQGRLASLAPAGTPHLVVMPPSLLFNWESELARFAPELRTVVYRGQERSTDFAGSDVILTSYDLVRRDIGKLADIPFHVIIFDEAQAVKNIHAAATGAVRRLRGAFKLALTGTPVENHLGEYWSIIDLVLPGLLGEYRRFGSARTDVPPELLQRLIARTHPFLLRRGKEEIAAELPDKVEVDLHLELTDKQRVLYQQTVAQIRSEVNSAWQRQTEAQARFTALTALTRLRRLCLDPRLIGEFGAGASSPKIEALVEQLLELRDEGHSVLVFSQFTSFLDLIEPALTQRQLPFSRLDGGTPVGARKKLVEDFQANAEPMTFLLSLKAGGRGLNLTRASYVIHLDPWWNPAVENQASDRAHRIGQTQKVTVLRLLMRHTVEEKMMLLKARKQQLYKALLEGGKAAASVPLTREDFEFLVGGSAA